MVNFLGLDKEYSDYDKSKIVVVSVPYEKTVSFGGGTALGPQAIIQASTQVELYDEELDSEPFKVGVHTRDELPVRDLPPEKMLDLLSLEVRAVLKDKKIPLIFGGEHSITTGAIRAIKDFCDDLCVLQLDAHADLRAEYQGSIYSHASVMSRIREICPAVQVGIRSLSIEEGRLIKENKYPVFFAHEIAYDEGWISRVIKAISSKNVFVTLDIDVFCSSLMPATGTPEPGGLDWYQVTGLLKEVGSRFNVVGMDIVELAPMKGFNAADFLTAKLAYKSIGYFWR